MQTPHQHPTETNQIELTDGVSFPKTIILKAQDPGNNNYVSYIMDHFRLAPPLNPNDTIKLMVNGNIKAIVYGYQINKLHHSDNKAPIQ